MGEKVVKKASEIETEAAISITEKESPEESESQRIQSAREITAEDTAFDKESTGEEMPEEDKKISQKLSDDPKFFQENALKEREIILETTLVDEYIHKQEKNLLECLHSWRQKY